ncbi:MAG: type IV pilin protein [bacterium]|jgi:type II secretion system protein G
MRERFGFTLVELLVVVSVIGVLSAIAIPNFLQAQTQAKISASYADMHALGIALEMYALDHNGYPLQAGVLYSGEVIYPTENPTDKANATKFIPYTLTTPVAYITSLPEDRFFRMPQDETATPELRYYFYSNFPQSVEWVKRNSGGTVPPFLSFNHKYWGDWTLLASGPDGDRKDIAGLMGDAIRDGFYDPSNGLISNGDILHSQKIPVAAP